MVFPGPLVSSTNKTDRHDITEILLKMALNTIKPTNTVVLKDVEMTLFKYLTKEKYKLTEFGSF
jgi:hypothetical protein